MEKCNFSTYISALDKLKKTASIKVTNFFLDGEEIKAMLAKNQCFIIENGNGALFLLKPWHNENYDVFFMARDLASLQNSIGLLPPLMGLRVAVIGRDPLAENTAALFTAAGYNLAKKLLRMRCKPAKPGLKKALRVFAEPYAENFDFARPEDAEEILEILSGDFDPVGDNLPGLDEIREAAAKKWIPLLRINGRIASLHYFTLHNNILNGLYDITRKEHRGGDALFPALKYYVDEQVPRLHPDIKRAYGWRDCKNNKLIKNAETLNQHYDGIVIYNMSRPASQSL